MGLATVRARNRSVRPPRRIPRWLVGLAAAVLLSAVLAVFGSRFLEVYRLEREAARLEALKRNLQEQNAVLREEMKLLQTPGYIEKIAREQLGLVRPGEIAILIVQPPAPAPRRPPQLRSDERGWLRRLWEAATRALH